MTIGGLVIVGSAIGDNRIATSERGIVRAFDARTENYAGFGIPSREIQAIRPSHLGEWQREKTGAANAWAQISVDADRNLVFIPTGSPSPDYYGGERPGCNSFADSVVALRRTPAKWSGIFRLFTTISGITTYRNPA